MPARVNPRPQLVASTRFFARPESFTLECPHCGTIYRIQRMQNQAHWEKHTSRFRCTGKDGCGRVYLIGILAWPIAGAGKAASQTPADQVPHPRQLAQMRKEGGGWWLPDAEAQSIARPDTTNLTLEEERPDDAEDED